MLYPQRYGEPKPTKPVGMPCGLKAGGSVRQGLARSERSSSPQPVEALPRRQPRLQALARRLQR